MYFKTLPYLYRLIYKYLTFNKLHLLHRKIISVFSDVFPENISVFSWVFIYWCLGKVPLGDDQGIGRGVTRRSRVQPLRLSRHSPKPHRGGRLTMINLLPPRWGSGEIYWLISRFRPEYSQSGRNLLVFSWISPEISWLSQRFIGVI